MTGSTSNQLLARAATVAVNRALALDAATRQRLAQQSGACINLHLRQPRLTFCLHLLDDGVQIEAEATEQPDLSIDGTPSGLASMALSEQPQRLLQQGEVAMQGNMELAEALQTLARDLQIDWEALLAKGVGDVAAHALGRRIRQGLKWSRAAGRSLLDSLDEYLHEELKLLPSRVEIRLFQRDLEELRMELDRLEARLKRFHLNNEKHSNNTSGRDGD